MRHNAQSAGPRSATATAHLAARARLRAQWQEQDNAARVYGDICVPIIDPDLLVAADFNKDIDPAFALLGARNAEMAALLSQIDNVRKGNSALRDADAAEDLFQEFACRFLHGDLRRANPERGRFRDYVKGVLFHMIADYHKKRQRLPRQMASDYCDPPVICEPDAEQEQAFLASWRDELLARTWTALAASDQAHGQSFHTVLRFRAEHRELRSDEMAEQLGGLLGKPLTAAGVRKTLERARVRFADLLLDEIAQALSNPTIEQLEQELIDLNLLEHCCRALERRGG